MAELTLLTNAQSRAALESVDLSASNFQVLSATIALGMVVSISGIGASIAFLQASDQTTSSQQVTAFTIAEFVLVAILALVYTSYLRNIGRYIYGRIRPVTFMPSKCSR